MPSYGSLHSPSLRKMNGNMDSSMRGRSGGMSGMSMENIIGDPFALATISISMVSLVETTECRLTTNSPSVGLVNRPYRYDCHRCQRRRPELRLVLCLLHVALYYRRLCGYRLQHFCDLPRSPRCLLGYWIHDDKLSYQRRYFLLHRINECHGCGQHTSLHGYCKMLLQHALFYT